MEDAGVGWGPRIAMRNVVKGEMWTDRIARGAVLAWRGMAVVGARTKEKHAQENQKGRVVSRPLVLCVCFV